MSLKIHDVLGWEVVALVDEVKSPGRYDVVWDASCAASGVYFCTLKADRRGDTKRMLLLR